MSPRGRFGAFLPSLELGFGYEMYRSYIGVWRRKFNPETKCYGRELQGTTVGLEKHGRQIVDAATVATPPSNFAVSSKLGVGYVMAPQRGVDIHIRRTSVERSDQAPRAKQGVTARCTTMRDRRRGQ